MKSILDATTKPVLFEIFPFVTIREFDGWNFWIENCEGEGLPIGKQELVTILLKYIKENI